MNKSVFAIVAAVLIAGCVGQTPTTGGETGAGLVITSFASDTASQYSERNVRLTLEVENQGETTVSKDTSLVYLSGPIGTDTLQWKLVEGSTPLAANFKRDLIPADPTVDRPAGTDTIRWTLTAPKLDAGQQKKDTFTARTYYDYETRVIGTIEAYPESESVAAREQGKTLRKSSFAATKGPVSINVRVIPDPVVVTTTDEVITLEIVVSNTGGGTVYKNATVKSTDTTPNVGFDDLNRVYLEVDAGALDKVGQCGAQYEELIGGKPTTLTCDFKVKKSEVTVAKSYPMKIKLDYGYYIDSSVDITALGRR